MIFDSYSPQVALALVQMIGLVGLALGRGSFRSRHAFWMQLGFFCCLAMVGSTLLFGTSVRSRWWLMTGTTFALMVVGTLWEVAPHPARSADATRLETPVR